MATFEITGPDGKKYRVEGENAEGALAAVQSMGGPTDDGRGGFIGNTQAIARGAVDAATFGFGDEIAAGLKTGFGFLGDYGAEVEKNRALMKADEVNRPWYRMGGQVAGGIGAGVATAPISLSVRAGQAGAALAPRIAAGAADGAVMGGLYGLGSGEGVGGRAYEAAKGGLLGGAIGGAFPVVASGVGHAYETARNYLAANPIARQAGASPEALRSLGAILDADGALGPQGQAAMARAGREGMLVDTGPTAQGVLDTVIQRGGPGARVAREAVDQRVARDSDELVRAMDIALGKPQGVMTTREGIRTGSSAARAGGYDAAYAAPINYADPRGIQIEEMVRGRVPPSAIRRANELMRIEGNQSHQILMREGADGAITFERLPDVRQLDYITRALNDVANDAQGTGALGGTSALGRAYEGLSRDIRSRLRDLVPEYGQALETAADPIRRSQAVDLGSRLLSRGIARDEAAAAVRGMTGPERQAAAQGIRSQIDEAMANVRRTATDPNVDARAALDALKTLSSPAAREKAALVMDPAAARGLFDELDRVAQSFELRAGVTTNSRTFGRTAINERVKETAGADSAVRTLARGEPVGATKRIVQALTGETPARQSAREDQIFLELARLLTRRGGAGQQVYDAIGQLGVTDASTAQARDALIRALSGTQLSYPAITQTQGSPR